MIPHWPHVKDPRPRRAPAVRAATRTHRGSASRTRRCSTRSRSSCRTGTCSRRTRCRSRSAARSCPGPTRSTRVSVLSRGAGCARRQKAAAGGRGRGGGGSPCTVTRRRCNGGRRYLRRAEAGHLLVVPEGQRIAASCVGEQGYITTSGSGPGPSVHLDVARRPLRPPPPQDPTVMWHHLGSVGDRVVPLQRLRVVDAPEEGREATRRADESSTAAVSEGGRSTGIIGTAGCDHGGWAGSAAAASLECATVGCAEALRRSRKRFRPEILVVSRARVEPKLLRQHQHGETPEAKRDIQ